MEKKSESCNFQEIEGSYLKNKCSPHITDKDFRGILINAPDTVVFDETVKNPLTGNCMKIVIAGTYRLKYDTLGLNGKFHKAILFVAVNAKTHKVYSGKMESFGTPARSAYRLEDDGLTEDDFKDVVLTEYINPDIASILSLPPVEAEYIVYATLGPYKSNEVRIQVVKAGKKPG